MRNGVLTAGGNAVHKVRRTEIPIDSAPQADQVAIVERYSEMAAYMHRPRAVPRGDRYLVGCTCGWFTLTTPGSSALASICAAQHVEDQAKDMHNVLEFKPVEAEGE